MRFSIYDRPSIRSMRFQPPEGSGFLQLEGSRPSAELASDNSCARLARNFRHLKAANRCSERCLGLLLYMTKNYVR